MEKSGQIHVPAALTPGTHWIEGGVDPRAGLDTAVAKRKKKNPFPHHFTIK
jgi:hypothetical protein